MKRLFARSPLEIALLAIAILLFVSNWKTRKQFDREHDERLVAIGRVEKSLKDCSPAVYLDWSSNPVDAVSLTRYRDNQNGHACVYLKDGRYGDFWWTIVTEEQGAKAHLEWNFNERGRYKW